jgi:hypothetical protein
MKIYYVEHMKQRLFGQTLKGHYKLRDLITGCNVSTHRTWFVDQACQDLYNRNCLLDLHVSPYTEVLIPEIIIYYLLRYCASVNCTFIIACNCFKEKSKFYIRVNFKALCCSYLEAHAIWSIYHTHLALYMITYLFAINFNFLKQY